MTYLFTKPLQVPGNLVKLIKDLQELKVNMENSENVNFVICIPLFELDTVISKRDIISIRYVYDCYCYHQNPRKTEFYICKKQTPGITNRDLINCLIDNNFNTQCNHLFLEGFDLNSEAQVTPWFGS